MLLYNANQFKGILNSALIVASFRLTSDQRRELTVLAAVDVYNGVFLRFFASSLQVGPFCSERYYGDEGPQVLQASPRIQSRRSFGFITFLFSTTSNLSSKSKNVSFGLFSKSVRLVHVESEIRHERAPLVR